MATLTKACLYCGREFEAAHSLANICPRCCTSRNLTPVTRRIEPGPCGNEPTMPPPGEPGRPSRSRNCLSSDGLRAFAGHVFR